MNLWVLTLDFAALAVHESHLQNWKKQGCPGPTQTDTIRLRGWGPSIFLLVKLLVVLPR